jgi:hypothetical protein
MQKTRKNPSKSSPEFLMQSCLLLFMEKTKAINSKLFNQKKQWMSTQKLTEAKRQ